MFLGVSFIWVSNGDCPSCRLFSLGGGSQRKVYPPQAFRSLSGSSHLVVGLSEKSIRRRRLATVFEKNSATGRGRPLSTSFQHRIEGRQELPHTCSDRDLLRFASLDNSR